MSDDPCVVACANPVDDYGMLYCVSIADGSTRWEVVLNGVPMAVARIGTESFAVAYSNGKIRISTIADPFPMTTWRGHTEAVSALVHDDTLGFTVSSAAVRSQHLYPGLFTINYFRTPRFVSGTRMAIAPRTISTLLWGGGTMC